MTVAEPSLLQSSAWIDFETRLRGYVRRRVDPAAVDDLVGEIRLRLVRHQDDLAAARSPVAWALKVAANAITDHHRRGAVERRALIEVQKNEEPDRRPAGGPTGATAAQELAACLRPMVRALPDAYEEALVLTDLDGLTQVEAARRLGLSTSGMKSRVQRGRKLLRETLLRCCRVEVDCRGGIVDYSRRQPGCGCINKEKGES